MRGFFRRIQGAVHEAKRARVHLRAVEALLKLYLLFVAAVGSAALLAASPGMQIEWIRVEGARSVPMDAIVSAVEEGLGARSFKIVGRDTPLWPPRDLVAAGIYAGDHRIRRVDVGVGFSRTLTATIEEESPAILWCGEEIPESPPETAEGCYFANAEGKIYAAAPAYGRSVFPIYHTAPWPIFRDQYPRANDFPLGYSVADEVTMGKIAEIRDALSEKGYRAARFGVTGDADVVLHTEEGVTFTLALSRNVAEDMARLEALEIALREKEERGFRKVDLRFPTKVYYQ